MKFIKLEVTNFACYYDTHEINLETDKDKNVIIIIGSNGFGKTTLFNAINWALYGEEYEKELRDNRNREITDYINEIALSEALLENATADFNCTLYFEHDNKNYYISQYIELEPIKKDDGSIGSKKRFRNTELYEIISEGDHKPIEHYKLLLDSILPNNVRDYFLFDGDRISALASPGSSQEVRDAIYRVVDLELLTNAAEHLNELSKEYAREAKRESKGELKDIEEKYLKERENYDKKKKEENDIKEELFSINRQIGTLESELKNIPDTSELQIKRNKLKNEVNNLTQHKNNCFIEIRKYSYLAGLSFASDECIDLLNELNSKREKGEIPRNISKTLLEDMLKIGECFICKEKIIKGNNLYKCINERLEHESKKKSNEQLLEYFFGIQDLSDNISNSKNSLSISDKKISDIDGNIKDLNLEIDQIDKDLKGIPKSDITGITNKLKELRDDLISNTRKSTTVHSYLKDLEGKIAELEKERNELSKKQSKVAELQLREKLARDSADEITKIYDVFAEDSRKSVEELTIEEFKKFVKSVAEYSVLLSNEYELEILDSNGNRALQRLSMGQSQCLSLAFITAIFRVSEKNPPLVIDMPFGRLDETVHGIISKRLPEITSQLILFLLPNTEWNEKTKKNLKSKAKFIYELDFDKTYRKTKIIKL